jgi:hypothetical protein
MNQTLAEAVVRCLGVSADGSEAAALQRFSDLDWKKTLAWLDNSGLALYLHRKLRDMGASEVLPPLILARLNQNLADNRRRVDRMTQELESLNQNFDQAGVNYILLKGFSLVPAFCPDAELRAPSDFDYFISAESMPAAQRLLRDAGYRLTRSSKIELGFDKPSLRLPSLGDSPYDPETEASVELHPDVWDSEQHLVQLEAPRFATARLAVGEWRGLRFPVLCESEAFLLQVLHVFQHVLQGWVKMSWLLEIGFFMDQRSADSAFWEEFSQRLRGNQLLEEFAAVVATLVAKVFRAKQPEVVLGWTQRLRPGARIWLDRYALTWVFCNPTFSESRWFPPAKLYLFLHQSYLSDPRVRSRCLQRRLFPWKRVPEILAGSMTGPAPRDLKLLLHLLTFHGGGGIRYLWEIPRWRRMNRLEARFPVGGLRLSSK